VIHGEQEIGRRDKLGTDLAGAVVQQLGEAAGESAVGAEPAAVELVLQSAP
jgi:hypothetical protein